MTSQIALVSETPHVSLAELTIVANALQKQVTRDFSLLWTVTATVGAFQTVEDAPVGSWHVVIRDDIVSDAAGIHQLDASHQPFALVRWAAQWSLTASHEILEMLADPFGNRLMPGDSPKPDQGRVLFLVEVCDPCQSAAVAYTVNGVLVSDFCTPDYFAPSGTSGARYSFSGAVTEPRQVLPDGYLTWLYPATGHLWQLLMEDGNRRLTDVGPQPPANACLRVTSDRATAKLRSAAYARAPRSGLISRSEDGRGLREEAISKAASASSTRIAATLRQQIQRTNRSG